MLNLGSLLETTARDHPDKTAVIFGAERQNYRQLNEAANRVAGGLKGLGVLPGQTVALMCPNVPEFPAAYYGTLKAGAVVVPFSPLSKAREVAYHLEDSGAVALLAYEAFAGEAWAGFQQVESCWQMVVIAARPSASAAETYPGSMTLAQLTLDRPGEFDCVQTASGDTAVILYTSGTTGKAKGAELSHSNLVLNALVSRDMMGVSSEDVILFAAPAFHSTGQSLVMNNVVLNGAAASMIMRWDPRAALDLIVRDRVSLLVGAPTLYWSLLNGLAQSGLDPKTVRASLRLAVCGGASMPADVLRGVEEKLGIPTLEGYGLSEATAAVCINHRHRPRKLGSIGTPVWGIEMRCVDANDRPVPAGVPGEILIRGHNVMNGYHRRPEDTSRVLRGGWLHTGDVGRTDDEGYFYVVDRLTDVINRAGYNVYPREVEDVLMSHPAVGLAAVIGVPAEGIGEDVMAVVQLKSGTHVTEDELMAFGKANLAAYKYPRLVKLVPALPLTASGKVHKTVLRAEVRQGLVPPKRDRS